MKIPHALTVPVRVPHAQRHPRPGHLWWRLTEHEGSAPPPITPPGGPFVGGGTRERGLQDWLAHIFSFSVDKFSFIDFLWAAQRPPHPVWHPATACLGGQIGPASGLCLGGALGRRPRGLPASLGRPRGPAHAVPRSARCASRGFRAPGAGSATQPALLRRFPRAAMCVPPLSFTGLVALPARTMACRLPADGGGGGGSSRRAPAVRCGGLPPGASFLLQPR